jgi:glucose/arabinose dehydrogenase
MAFLSDGTMFFDLRSGPIKVRLPDGTVKQIVVPSDVRSTGGEGGMLGIAVDPDLASNPASVTNRYLYACYSTLTDTRVVRFQVNSTFDGVDATVPIITGIPHNEAAGGRHSGCRPRFRPGTSDLFVGTGDAAIGTNPQDTTSLGGKVLRVDRNGAGIAGNPFFGPTAGDDRIYTYGQRNVQGVAFRTADSEQPFSAEHGTGCDDEVNKLTPGANFGWDPVPGYDESRPMTDFAKFPTAVAPVWKSGCPTLAPSGMTFLAGPQWKSWDGAAAVGMLKTMKLVIMFMNGAGTVTSTFDGFTPGVRLRSPVQSPSDGNLYIGTDSGEVWKITPS